MLFSSENRIDLVKFKTIQLPCLKRLAFGENFFDTENNLLLFMSKLVNTLEELDLGQNYPESFYEQILKKFYKLRTLSVVMKNLPTSDSFYQNLGPNLSVRNLVIKSDGDPKTALKFVKMFPNIESLEVHSKLIPMFDGANIPSLKSITICTVIGDIYEDRNWRAMCRCLPNIETFRGKSFLGRTTLNDETFSIFTEGWTRLRHVRLSKGFIATDIKFNHLLNNCQVLERVELLEDAFKDSTCDREAISRSFKQKDKLLIIQKGRERCNYHFCFEFWLGCGKL